MLKYGKTSQHAISIMSLLAANYDGGTTILSSGQISTIRKLPKPIVAKLLTLLSQAGLLNGTPGPKGGYYLAKDPATINLLDIVTLFEKTEDNIHCPFGPGWCGNNEPCPLHDSLIKLNENLLDFLRETNLAVFLE